MKPLQPSSVSEVIRRFGGPLRVSQICGLSHSTVTYWQEIPLRYVEVMARTIGCRPTEIRPDLAALFELELYPIKDPPKLPEAA